MRITVLFLSLVFACSCLADPILYDAFGSIPGESATICSSNPIPSTCDVVGGSATLAENWDIRSAQLSVSNTTATLTLALDYDASSGTQAKSLAGYNYGGTNLNVGDVFFYDPSDTKFSTPLYAVSLVGHATYSGAGTTASPYVGGTGVTADELYKVTNSLTAQQALDATNGGQTPNPSGVYRNSQIVWVNDTTLANSSGPVPGSLNYLSAVTPTPTTPSLTVQLTFSTSGAVLNNGSSMFSGGKIGFGFESATCANDIIQGDFTNYTPEPSSLLLAAGGLLLLGAGLLRRKRAA